MFNPDNILHDMQNVFQFKVVNEKQDVEVKHIKYIPLPPGEAIRTEWYEIENDLYATDYILRTLDKDLYLFKNIANKNQDNNFDLKETIIFKLNKNGELITGIKKEELNNLVLNKLSSSNFEII